MRNVVVRTDGTDGTAPSGTQALTGLQLAGLQEIDRFLDELRGSAEHPELAAARWQTVGDRLLQDVAVRGLPADGGTIRLRVEPADEERDASMAAVGFEPVRTLLQLRCPLPLAPAPHPRAAIRAFRRGQDEAAWLAVNNAAFSWHPEQGGWSRDRLEHELSAEWFDAEDLLVATEPATSPPTMAGFCWTKLHPATDPVLGEIYVIAVDPAHHGRGLGRALVHAGLDHLSDQGADAGMLWVESDNEVAGALYRDLGFTEHHRTTYYESVGATGADEWPAERSGGATP